MFDIKTLALLKHGKVWGAKNIVESALLNKWGGGASYEKTVGPAPIISIADAKAKPAKSLVVGMEPIQDLHGYDSPWPAGGGKNLLPFEEIIPNGWSATANGITATYNNGVMHIQGTHTISGWTNIVQMGTSFWSGFPFKFPSGITMIATPLSVDHATSITLFAMVDGTSRNISNGSVIDSEAEVYVTGFYIAVQGEHDFNFDIPMIVEAGTTRPTAFSPYSNLCPISGRTGVTVERTGVNIFDETPLKSIGTYPNHHGGGYYVTDIYRLFSGTYTATFLGSVSKNLYYRIFIVKADGSKVGKDLVDGTTLKPQTFTIEDGGGIVLGVAGGKSQSYLDDVFANTHFMLVCGSTAPTAYEPYTGTSYPVTWQTESGTVYGGTVDVVSGVLTVTHAMVDLGTLNWNIYQTQFYAQLVDAKIPSYISMPNAICSLFKPVTFASITSNDNSFAINSGQSRVNIVASAYSTPAEFKTAMSGVQLVYEVATPQTYQLTPQQIQLLKGSNTLWSDGDSLTLTYIGTQPANLLGGGLGNPQEPTEETSEEPEAEPVSEEQESPPDEQETEETEEP